MDHDLDTRLKEIERKIDRMEATMRKVWAIYKWSIIIALILVIVPLVAMTFVLPSYFKSLDINGLL